MYSTAPPRPTSILNTTLPSSSSRNSDRRFSHNASVGFRRSVPIRASVSTFAEPIPLDSRRSLSLYDILRVKQTASPMEIKTAYRSLAKVYHPDAALHEETQLDGLDFIEIHNAYETLSDPASRALYDLSLSAAGRRGNYRQSRRRSAGFSGGNHPTRRWETDQCW